MFIFIDQLIISIFTSTKVFLEYLDQSNYFCRYCSDSSVLFYICLMSVVCTIWYLLSINKIYYTSVYMIAPFSIMILVCAKYVPWYTTAFFTWLLIGLGLFFRNPNRDIRDIDITQVLSPADGIVLDVTYDVMLPRGFQDLSKLGNTSTDDDIEYADWSKVTKISIFMRVTDVHLNRAPIAGKIMRKMSFSGKFMYATAEQADRVNERVGLWIKGLKGSKAEVVVFQIAGMLAKRVICHANADDIVNLGEIYGVIQFGSRADIYIPGNVKVLVSKEQTLLAGIDILAQWI